MQVARNAYAFVSKDEPPAHGRCQVLRFLTTNSRLLLHNVTAESGRTMISFPSNGCEEKKIIY